MPKASDIVCIESLFPEVRISFFPAGEKSYLCTVAFGTNTAAGFLICQKQERHTGAKSSNETEFEMRKTGWSLNFWDGECLWYGNVKPSLMTN
jgi:hypothetical protein